MSTTNGNSLQRALYSTMKKLGGTVLRDFGQPAGKFETGFTYRPTSPPVAATDLVEIALLAGGGTKDPWFEKTRWSVSFTYRGAHCQMRHGKFGFRIDIERDSAVDATELGAEIADKLTKAVNMLNKRVATPSIDAELAKNAVRLNNQYSRYRGMVDHFILKLRDDLTSLAQERAAERPAPEPRTGGGVESVIEAFAQIFGEQQSDRNRTHEVAYTAIALVAGYFSYLQHVLILLSGFSPKALEDDFKIVELLRSGWAEQFTTVFVDVTEAETNRVLCGLKELAGEYRNPLLHGSRPEDGIIAEWLPGRFGLVTRDGRLGDRHSPWEPSLTPDQAAEILRTIETVDSFLSRHPYWEWVRSGIPVSFHRAEVARAIRYDDRGEVGKYTEYMSDAYDRSLNME